MERLVVVVVTALAVMAVSAVGGSRGSAAAAAGCLVAPDPTQGGPPPPTELTAELPPLPAGYTQADLAWIDNADNEACYIVERERGTLGFEIIAVVPPDSTTYHDDGPYGEGEAAFYRVYASTETARSEYSNVDGVGFPIVEPTPTSTPAPARGDVDCDGEVDSADALHILRFVVDLPPNLPPGCPPVGEMSTLDQLMGTTTWLAVPFSLVGGLAFFGGTVVRRRRWRSGLAPGQIDGCECLDISALHDREDPTLRASD